MCLAAFTMCNGEVVWELRFRARQYFTGSLWFLPLIGGLAGAALGSSDVFVERGVEPPAYLQYSASTATAVLSAIVGATAALTGFVVTVSVLVVQMATNTFSARYMRLWQRDRLLQVVLAFLVGTFTFAFTLLGRVEGASVPDVGVSVTGLLMAVDLFLFLFFLDRFVHRLRPVAVAALVASAGRKAFGSVVRAASSPNAPEIMTSTFAASEEPSLVVRSRRAGSIQALDGEGMMRFARAHGCTLVLDHAVGVERTIEQDPAFAVRIMVDVAIKALSPAVNDPTTAVQVINHLGDLLHRIGATDFQAAAPAEPGTGRVLIASRGWEQYLALGVTEIRGYGASSVQVARRLRAMLVELHGAVLPEHRPAVEDELERLEAAVALALGTSPDLDRAGEADKQGLGGAPGL